MTKGYYFVTRANVPTAFRERGILTLRQEIGGERGFIFPAEYKNDALESLQWEAQRVVELPTSEWSVDWLVQRDGEMVADVCIRYHDRVDADWQAYLELVASWCRQQALAVPVVIHYFNGRHDIYANGQVHLCFGGRASFKFKSWSFERDLLYQRSHLWIGELGPEHQACRDLIPTILDKFMPRIYGSGYLAGKEEMMDQGTISYQAQLDTAQAELLQANQEVEQLQQRLVTAIRREKNWQQRWSELQQKAQRQRNWWSQLLDRLAAREYVTAVWYENNALYVLTERKTTVIQGTGNKDGRYDLGEYLIIIYLDGREGCVRIFNQTQPGPVESERYIGSSRERGRCQHPHVAPSGQPCLGLIKETIPRYVAQGDYEAVCDLLSWYLETVDVNDAWGRTVVCWPKFE